MEEIKLTRREKNIQCVIKNALEAFIENGIDNTKISDIADKADLTERSIFRYFDTKADLVLQTALLIWHSVTSRVERLCLEKANEETNGKGFIDLVIHEYGNLYFSHPKELIFIHEAESYLYRCGKTNFNEIKSPTIYKENSGPLSRAINTALDDGSIHDSEDLDAIYYNTYDSLLGLIQKMAINHKKFDSIENDRKRIKILCDQLVALYK